MASCPSGSTLEGLLQFSQPATAERLKEVAKNDLGETEELKEKCLRMLRNLIEENKVACITTDDFLLRFLRTRKFNVQKSFESLCNYARHRVGFHKRLTNLEPEVMQKCLRLNMLNFLPYRDAEERLMMVITNDIWTPSICTVDDFATTLAVLSNYGAEDPSSQVNGMVVISRKAVLWNSLPYILRHVKFVTVFLFRNCLPIRYKGLHCVDAPAFFRWFVFLLRPLIPQKIRGRLFVHGESREEFLQHVSPSVLPSELGGSLGPMNNDHAIDIMTDYLQKLKDEQRYFIQEDL